MTDNELRAMCLEFALKHVEKGYASYDTEEVLRIANIYKAFILKF